MGTNYYVHTPNGQEIHLGKQSVGWPFAFRGYPERGVVTYEAWRAQFDLGQIHNEYGRDVTPDEMEEIVREARKYRRHQAFSGQVDDAKGNRFSCYEFC